MKNSQAADFKICLKKMHANHDQNEMPFEQKLLFSIRNASQLCYARCLSKSWISKSGTTGTGSHTAGCRTDYFAITLSLAYVTCALLTLSVTTDTDSKPVNVKLGQKVKLNELQVYSII